MREWVRRSHDSELGRRVVVIALDPGFQILTSRNGVAELRVRESDARRGPLCRGPDLHTKKTRDLNGDTQPIACCDLADLGDPGGGRSRAGRKVDLRQVAGWARATSVDDNGNLAPGVHDVLQRVGFGVGMDCHPIAGSPGVPLARSELQVDT